MSRKAVGLVGGGAAGGLAVALWWRTHPSACPYAQRLGLLPPRPFITRKRLPALLAPRPGERILDVGVGFGYYALDVANRVQPDGTVCALDLQPRMLDRAAARARRRSLTNVELAVGDARALPYPDGQFDAAYLVTVLGEIPDQAAALREAHRVLRPGGRLVVGEVIGDPHMVRMGALQPRAATAASASSADWAALGGSSPASPPDRCPVAPASWRGGRAGPDFTHRGSPVRRRQASDGLRPRPRAARPRCY